MRPSEPPPVLVAYHEAGHVICGHAVGLYIARVCIRGPGDPHGRATIEQGPITTQRELERQMVTDVGGPCSESAVLGSHWSQSALGSQDVMRAGQLALDFYRGDWRAADRMVEWASATCLAFLRRPAARAALDALTLELIARRVLDASELQSFFRKNFTIGTLLTP